mmetsp:Transcript_21638/g.36236  ORF Transcript_21638/g.36236 Transcript_21638/m.36236 type:complete len:228 (-) Transcript_21638:77-760(-)
MTTNNPWSISTEDIALGPLRDYLDSHHNSKGISIALASEKLQKDPNDLINRLREADERTKEMQLSKEHCHLKEETLLANELAKELTTHVNTIIEHLTAFDQDNAFKISYLHAVGQVNSPSNELAPENKMKLIEYLQISADLIQEFHAHMTCDTPIEPSTIPPLSNNDIPPSEQEVKDLVHVTQELNRSCDNVTVSTLLLLAQECVYHFNYIQRCLDEKRISLDSTVN